MYEQHILETYTSFNKTHSIGVSPYTPSWVRN